MDKPAATVPEIDGQSARRRYLSMAISTVLLNMGFDQVEKQCLETLCEMFQSCKWDILGLLFLC